MKARTHKGDVVSQWQRELDIQTFPIGIVLLVTCVLLTSALAGWFFFRHNFNNHLEAVADEADAVLALSSSYVSLYSRLRSESNNTHLPVPAKFRAQAAELSNRDYSGEEHFMAKMVGMPGRHIITPVSDAQMSSTLIGMKTAKSTESVSFKIESDGKHILRTLYPSIASQQSCVDCHNKIQNANTQWQLGDVMGAYVIERGIGLTKRRYTIFGWIVSSLVALSLFSGMVVFRQQRFLKKQSAYLKVAADTDPLTGCLNRRALYAQIRALSAEERKNAGLLLLDIDHFKNINDAHGHDAGDKALVDFVTTVQSVLRKEDIFARTGGEEFTIYMPDLAEQEAKEVADRIRVRVSTSYTEFENVSISYTVSIGGIHTSHDPTQTIGLYRQMADNFLYKAKENGRNCVVWAV